ncbi:MAG: sugar ABC transporter ATP-binding protein [Eubacteriales bacterium]|nr:sugar ABC transporter ATP-binding protein [Eubacteriales bacterium]
MKKILELRGINKSFGGVSVLNNVDLDLYAGEILGLIGENGAGKSTLMKIIVGAIQKYSGTVTLNREKLQSSLAGRYLQDQIGLVLQELSVFLDLTVTQNIFINQEIKTKFNILKQREMNIRAKEILKEGLGVDIDPNRQALELSLGQRQSLEIARVLCNKKRVIIMDEPTAALEDNERECLFKSIQKIKESGTSVIFISHHLEEILRICDRVMILKDGYSMGEFRRNDIDKMAMIKLMIGKTVKNFYPKEKVAIGDSILKVVNLRKKSYFKNINFDLKCGEVLGLAGLEGCGKNEILRCIFGAHKYDEGKIVVKSNSMKKQAVTEAMGHGIAFLPAERKTEGIFPLQDVSWNMIIANMVKKNHFFVKGKKEEAGVNEYINSLSIKVANNNQLISHISGGNQQKIMLARWLMTGTDIFLFEEPTRGIDVNAKTEVYLLIGELVKSGKGVCIVSSDLPELLGICDRILIISEGEIMYELNPKEITEHELTDYITKSKELIK